MNHLLLMWNAKVHLVNWWNPLSPRSARLRRAKSVLNLKSLLKTPTTPKNTSRRVIFNPLALLLDAAAIGELDLLIKSAKQVRLILRRLSLLPLFLR